MTHSGGVLRLDHHEHESEGRDWWTAAELAELQLPGLPGDKRSLNRRAHDERWQMRSDAQGGSLSRPRAGRGGGIEFHVSLLPGETRLELARRGLCAERPAPTIAESPAAASWRWYEGQGAKTRAEAERRLAAIAEIDLLEESGLTRTAAIAETSRRKGVSTATLWNWLKLVEGVAKSDRLPALAPRRQGGGAEAEIDALIWAMFRSDYLRPECPTLASCYARCVAKAAELSLSLPSEKAFRRRLEREVAPAVILLARGGAEKLRRSIPSQRRSVMEMHALELVNIDGHKFDVFVTPPGGGSPIRPTMVAIQDVYSRKLLAWRIDLSETAVLTRLAFADLFAKFGIPKACLMDNGRAFASKWISGGAKTRFRFKIKEDEPTGLLTALGIDVRWAKPYRGQSKPIERAFRDLCDSIARHPAAAGAYVGNNPMAKPENYGSKAMGWDAFLALVEKGVHAHNAKLGRKGGACRGRSFDETFAESYAAAPIGKATPEQLRMALLTAEQVTVDRRTGEVKLFNNRYWSQACGDLHGQQVTVRFDPDDLHSAIHLYDREGRYLTAADVIRDTGFSDVAGAKAAAKRDADYRRRIREGLLAEQLYSAEQVAALQAETIRVDMPEPAIIRPVRHRGNTAAALKAAPVPVQSQQESTVFRALSLVPRAE